MGEKGRKSDTDCNQFMPLFYSKNKMNKQKQIKKHTRQHKERKSDRLHSKSLPRLQQSEM